MIDKNMIKWNNLFIKKGGNYMKKNNFYSICGNQIIFTRSENRHTIPANAKIDVMIEPVRKSAGAEVANAIANAASSSLGNGNERVNVAVQIQFDDEMSEVLQMNETPLVRNNLDYHEAVRHARNLQAALKKDLTLN